MTRSNCSITPGVYRFTVREEHAGLRLDQYLATVSEFFSRGLARKVIDLGGAHYDGRRTRRCGMNVAPGNKIEVFVDDLPLSPAAIEDKSILYHDKDLLVINKPAGMPTQPTPSRYLGTLYAEVQKLLQNPGRKDLKPSIGMVQRLDRDTSGVIVFSIHQRAHKKLTEQFKGHNVEKKYLALVTGGPEQSAGVITSHLARRRSTNLMVSVEHGGQYAETRYRVLQRFDNACLVEIDLVTGRSHQIRAHFSEAGCPLLGDKAYGGPVNSGGFAYPRQMLHATTLTLRHPANDDLIHFEAPLPGDFSRALDFLEGSLKGPQG